MVTNNITLDSCLIKIPYEFVRVNEDSGILDTWVTYNVDTQKMEDSERSKRLVHEFDGYKVYFSLQDRNDKGYTEHYLVITLCSKLLEHQYLEGITYENIRSLYDRIQLAGIVQFEFEDFISKSICTDVEFKFDFVCSQELYDRMKEAMMGATPYTQDLNVGYIEYESGVTWNRRPQAPVSHPFVELYDKHEELNKNKNDVFRCNFLSGIDTTGLRRIEFNLKNKKHFTSYDIYDCSLGGILKLTPQRKSEIMKKVLGRVVDLDKVKKNVAVPDLPPAQQILFSSLKDKLDEGKSFSTAVSEITAPMNPNNAFKYRAKFQRLYDKYFHESNTREWILDTPLQFVWNVN